MLKNIFSVLYFMALPAVIMAYGWAYRGTVGHEAGAMVPGALLGLALCLASGRRDWQRRSVVVGLFGAVGFSWGGSLSYMEQTAYTLSDSFPDVYYGYSMLFFLGALWAGCAGAVLGLAFTEPRSELERFVRPFTAICTVFLLVYFYFLCFPAQQDAYETLTVRHFHDGDWLAATLTLVVSGIYWLACPKDRAATTLFFWAAVAWWLGYGILTQLFGLRLAPLHRSESWGGVLGILATLIIYLYRRNNKAALMLCLYGILGGGLGFAAAVFIRHPFAIQWTPLTQWMPLPQWRTAEASFGLFMGIAFGLAGLRLIKDGLVSPDEDRDSAPLDVYGAFVILVALQWMNFRRHFERLLENTNDNNAPALWGLTMSQWYLLLALCITAPVLYCLYRYLRGDRALTPQSSFGKGVAVAVLLVSVTVVGQLLDGLPSAGSLPGHLLLWIPAILSIWLLLGFSRNVNCSCDSIATTPATDPKWNPGVRYWALCGLTPVIILVFTLTSMAIQTERANFGRKRFGEDAYWRQTARLTGTWKVIGISKNTDNERIQTDGLPIQSIAFDPYRNVTLTLPSGETVEDRHQWFLKNQYIWMHWHGKIPGYPEQVETPLHFKESRLYIAVPPEYGKKAFMVLEKEE